MQKKLLPYLAPIGLFALITIIYFLPLYQGKTLGSHDITQWKAMAQETITWRDKTGQQPLWTNSMFSGMPTFQISMIYSGNWVSKIPVVLRTILPDVSLNFFLLFVGVYVLLISMGVNIWLSTVGAIGYGFASFNAISLEAGHNTKVMAMALMAPTIAGVFLAYNGRILLGAALTALFVSMNIDANHFQITYYLMLTIGFLSLYFLIESIRKKAINQFLKASVALVIGASLGMLPNIANLWSTYEYGKQTMRGGGSQLTQKKEMNTGGGLDFEYATRWSEGAGDFEFMSILIPNIKGGASGSELSTSSATYKVLTQNGIQGAENIIKRMPTYFGEQPGTSGPVYYGAAIFFLFVLGMFLVRSPIKWALFGISSFFILISFGHNTPFFKIFFELLPMFNKFRTPAMALAVPQLCFPVLAALALQEISTGKISGDDFKKKLYYTIGICGGLTLVFGVFGMGSGNYTSPTDIEMAKQYPDWLMKAIKEDRASMLHTDAFRSLFFIAITAGLIWVLFEKKISSTIFAGAILFFVLLDNGLVATRYLNSDDFQEDQTYAQNFQPSQADLQILQDPDPYYRVYDRTVDPFNTASPAYFHKLIGGYSPAKLQIYQDLIERQIAAGNPKVFDMLNTKYFKIADEQGNQRVIPNSAALGNVWFVQSIIHVNSADEEIDTLGSNNFNPASAAVIHKDFNQLVNDNSLGNDSSAAIKLDSYSPDKLAYSYNSTTPQVAVFSEIYYAGKHGWKAYVDGKEVEHFRCNYVLRGLALPAGKHTVEFRFEPESYYLGNKVAYAGSFFLFAFVLGTLGFTAYSRFKTMQVEVGKEAVIQKPTPAKSQKKK